jgi:hypothetical protein
MQKGTACGAFLIGGTELGALGNTRGVNDSSLPGNQDTNKQQN